MITKTQANIANLLRKAGRKVTVIDATDPRKPPVVSEQAARVEHTTRRVIEGKLLEALEDENTVALLATERDLAVIIHGLRQQALSARAQELAGDLERLRDGAFGKRKTVHFLFEGRTPCGMPGVPREWAPNQFWSVDLKEINCTQCLGELKRK